MTDTEKLALAQILVNQNQIMLWMNSINKVSSVAIPPFMNTNIDTSQAVIDKLMKEVMN